MGYLTQPRWIFEEGDVVKINNKLLYLRHSSNDEYPSLHIPNENLYGTITEVEGYWNDSSYQRDNDDVYVSFGDYYAYVEVHTLISTEGEETEGHLTRSAAYVREQMDKVFGKICEGIKEAEYKKYLELKEKYER